MSPLTRRNFITTLAQGAASIAILGVAACSNDPEANPTVAGTGASTTSTTQPGSTTSAPTTTSSTQPPATTSSAPPSAAPATTWERVRLSSVSAYILERNGEAALVDTGTGGSAGQIEEALGRLGLRWTDLGHVILTHRHGDHVGSLDAVLAAAPDATGYIGAGDAAAVTPPRPLTIVADSDKIFDLEIIETPGHTPGSISVFDPIGLVLVSGDALLGGSEPGSVAAASPRFSDDMATADQSVVKLAGFQPAVILPGHGEPITADASTKLNALAATL